MDGRDLSYVVWWPAFRSLTARRSPEPTVSEARPTQNRLSGQNLGEHRHVRRLDTTLRFTTLIFVFLWLSSALGILFTHVQVSLN